MARAPTTTPGQTPAPDAPLPNSYWVVPGRLLAGEYPGGPKRALTRERLARILDAGIDTFFDLTLPGELEPYARELPRGVEHRRWPIRDHGVPGEPAHLEEILAELEQALAAGRRVYVHCRAGIGRTGTIVGCWLVQRGLSGDDALYELNRLWQQCGRSKSWGYVPETDEQIEYVRQWMRGPAASAGEPGAAAPRPADSEPEPVPLPSGTAPGVAPDLRTRFLGALVGLAVGDALATPVQGREPGTFPPVTDVVGGGTLGLPRGAWSDDTALALCLAESLLERNGFDPRDQVERYWLWQQEGRLSATGQCVGITQSTTRALALARWRRQLFSGSHDPRQLDPEPLSRVAPAVMFFFGSARDAVQYGSDAARTTCQAPAVLDACRLFAAILHGALSGQGKAQVLAPGADLFAPSGLKPRVEKLAQGAYRQLEPGAVRAGGIVDALQVALWAFDRTDDFAAGALLAANVGGNCDVAAAAYGQLAGAYYGLGGVPAAWRSVVVHRELIEGFASRLLARAGAARTG